MPTITGNRQLAARSDVDFGWGSPRPVLLAERVMKARGSGRCALDGCPITAGVRIGQLPDGRGWATVACIVRANQGSQPATEGS